MKKIFVTLLGLIGTVLVSQANNVSDLQVYARNALIAAINQWGDDINRAGICIVRSKVEVVLDVDIEQRSGKTKDLHEENAVITPCGIVHVVLKLEVTPPEAKNNKAVEAVKTERPKRMHPAAR